MVDLTACVGGNVLSFSKKYHHVVGVELDPLRSEMLQHNVTVMARTHPARVLVGDCKTF
jgi:predicted RNA methylase